MQLQEREVEEAAKLCANNHAKFENWAWTDRPEHSERYYIWNYSNRDSRLTDESNASVIEEELGKFEDVELCGFGHWAVGHLNAAIVPVYNEDGSITDAFKKCFELQERLKTDPFLDESDHSDRTYKATLENLKDCGYSLVKDNPPDDWPDKVYDWFDDHDDSGIRSRDDQGGYPDKEQMIEALHALKLLDPTESPYEVDEFPPGTKVMVNSAFSAHVIYWDEDYLIVENCCCEKFKVMPGEVEHWSAKDEDSEQFRLFYQQAQSEEYYTWEDWARMNAEYLKGDDDEEIL